MKKIGIIGGGISGLTLGCVLKGSGKECIIFERSNALSEHGAGISLTPNACKILDEIDILDSEKLYKFFQTKKKYRKKIGKINFLINYDFISQSVKIERLSIDNETSDPIQNFVRDFNAQDNQLKNRVELRNFFNLLIENYAG